MTKEEINQKIAELEAQRDEIERQEREQVEAEKRKARAEREAELQKIKASLDKFNEKYNDTLYLSIKRNSDAGNDVFATFFPWI